MANIVKGDDLMLFDSDGHSFAFATSHTLTMSTDTVDVACKDYGFWGAQEVSKISWEITSENLFSDAGYDKIFNYFITREEIDIYFGHTQEGDGHSSLEDHGVEYWTKSASGFYKGKAMISSLTVNANTGENATYSVTLTGIGSLVQEGVTTTAGAVLTGTLNASGSKITYKDVEYTYASNGKYVNAEGANYNIFVNGVSITLAKS